METMILDYSLAGSVGELVMDLIGDTLRRARVRQGLRLEQVAAKTKIGSHFLHAMEQNRFENLPGGLFTRSFLRQYTHILGLNEDEIITALKEQFEEPPLNLPVLPLQRGSSRIPQLPAFGWLLVTIIVCGGVCILWENVSRSLPVAKATSAPKLVEETGLKPRLNQVAPVDTTAGNLAALGQSRVDASALGPQPEGTVHALFTATEAVWISVKSGGTPVFTGMLADKQSKEFESSGKMTVLVGNAGGLRVLVNGTPVAPIGAHGEVQQLVLTAKGAQIVPRKASVPLLPPAVPVPSLPVSREEHR
jgi:cytoskeleton protein RodZ